MTMDQVKHKLIHHVGTTWHLSRQLCSEPEDLETLTVYMDNKETFSIEHTAMIKWLGVIFDTKLTFREHVNSVVVKANRQIEIF